MATILMENGFKVENGILKDNDDDDEEQKKIKRKKGACFIS